jgi:hypothetical protein
MTCKIGERFPAKQVFASLTGDAIKLNATRATTRPRTHLSRTWGSR